MQSHALQPRCRQQFSRPAFTRARPVVLCAIKARSGQQVVCSKTIVAKKEKAEQVLEMCQDIEAFSQQLLRDRSSGLVEYACMKDRWEDNVIHIWERFDSNASLSNYTATDKVKAFMQQVNPLLDEPIGMAMYQFQDGNIGSACLAEGPKGEGGLDDATGAGGAGGASMKQTSATVNLTNIKEDEDEPVFNIDMGKGLASVKDLFGKVFGKKS